MEQNNHNVAIVIARAPTWQEKLARNKTFLRFQLLGVKSKKLC
tara:strand:- start:547 stop:675 length:129 start_codon:yes stop_codon:yes gene_type:complete